MKNEISIPTLKRLPSYYNIVCNALGAGEKYISSASIARVLDVDDTQVRKDIAAIGYAGKPKVGFDLIKFKVHLEEYLEFDKKRKSILIGAGNLGIALSRYQGFAKYGLSVVAIFDNDPLKIGLKIADKEVLSLEKLKETIVENNIKIAILTIPSNKAQETTDMLISLGIKAIWNFSPIALDVPSDVFVQNQDLGASFTTFVNIASIKNII